MRLGCCAGLLPQTIDSTSLLDCTAASVEPLPPCGSPPQFRLQFEFGGAAISSPPTLLPPLLPPSLPSSPLPSARHRHRRRPLRLRLRRRKINRTTSTCGSTTVRLERPHLGMSACGGARMWRCARASCARRCLPLRDHVRDARSRIGSGFGSARRRVWSVMVDIGSPILSGFPEKQYFQKKE